MRSLARMVGVLSAALVVTVALGTGAGAAGRVGPQQYFTGVINGTDGNTANPITIRMACFGPLHPGQTGHPLGGQTLAVHQLFPPAPTPGSLGDTGDDSVIDVFFHTPPPAAAPARASGHTPSFTRYDKVQRLPTSITLPCAGTGTVWFSPLPVVPPSQSASVPVQYVGQP
jgi:hypothetical protein